MKLYSIKATGYFGAGMAVVVADSHDHALRVAAKERAGNYWNIPYSEGECELLLDVMSGGGDDVKPGVLDYFEYSD